MFGLDNFSGKAKTWLAAILVAAFSLTGLVPAQAVPGPAITLANSGVAFTGTTISGFATTDILQLQLSALPSANVLSPTLNFPTDVAGVTFAAGSASGNSSITIEGTQAALNAAFAQVKLGELGEETNIEANITIPAIDQSSVASATAAFSPTVLVADAPTSVLASPGQNSGEIDLSFAGGSNYEVGQLYAITATQEGTSVATVADSAPGVVVISALPADLATTFTVTSISWLNAQTGFSYTGGSTASAESLSQGSGGVDAATPVWSDENLNPFLYNTPYADGVLAGSPTPITYVITSGALPTGTNLNSSTGEITGTPSSYGTYSFTLTAKTSPSWISLSFSFRVIEYRGCESYTNASYASNIFLNPDGTPIGCDYEAQPAELRPTNWDTIFSDTYGATSNRDIRYSTRLGWSCDDCSIGASGQTTRAPGIPIGFDINFFGTTYSDVFINSNGSISFGSGSSNYGDPLNEILDGAAGLVPFGVDLDNRDVTDIRQRWGTGERHADFYYWGRSTYEGKDAFVATWMNSQIYSAGTKKDFNTFQVIIVNTGNGNADYIINYGSMQDANNEAGYGCASGTCLAAGFGSNQGGTTLYASLQDGTGFLYNGSETRNAIDGGSKALSQATLNSEVPGQFIFNMVDGYVPEVATLSGAPTNFSAVNTDASVAASWSEPLNVGGSPIGSYIVRYRLAGTTDVWQTTNTETTSTTITGLAAGDYVFQVAAVNEIGTSAYSRSYLVSVAGPLYANMVAYDEALRFAATLNQNYYTPETWATLATALGTSVTRENTQVAVDAQTLLINTALAGLIVADVQVVTVDFTSYLEAVTFAENLKQTDFTAETWAPLADALAVPIVEGTSTQAEVDAQTDAINAALRALVLKGIGSMLVMADLTSYNSAVAAASVLRESRFSTASWAALQAALTVPITRDNTQSEVNTQTAAINAALAALVLLANLVAYDLAVSDTVGLTETTYSPASWATLQAALAVSVSASSTQAAVDAATAAINAAVAGLVVYADLTAYNAAVATAETYDRNIHTADSWRALALALAVYVNRETDAQIYVDIATTNILSAIASLVQGDPGEIANMTAYNAIRQTAASKLEVDFTLVSWTALQTVRRANVVFDSNTQAEVDAAAANISAAIDALVASANTVSYLEAVALAASKIEASYTALSWAALQAALPANVVTRSNTQAEVDNATRLINLAIGALAALDNSSSTSNTPTQQSTSNQLKNPIVAPPVAAKKIVALSLQRIVLRVLKNNVPVLNGKRVMSPVTFSGNSWQLDSGDIKSLAAFATSNANVDGWLLISGYAMFNGKSNTLLARKVAAARAKTVATLLLSLGIKAEIGFAGYGAPNTKSPKVTDRKVEIRWVASL